MMEFEKMGLQELLAAVLRTDKESETIKEFSASYRTAKDIYHATVEEIMEIKGVGRQKAQLIKAAMELGIRILSAPTEEAPAISTPKDAYNLLASRVKFFDKEHFMVVTLTTKNRVISINTVSIGSLNSTVVHPREVYKYAIKQSAASIVLVHNHPSRDSFPSQEDMEITRRLYGVSSIMGINIVDHVIIGGDNYYSFKENGLVL